MSMKPGAAIRPLASMRAPAGAPAREPMAAMVSPRMPMSPTKDGLPGPSATRAPVSTRAKPAGWAKRQRAVVSARQAGRMAVLYRRARGGPSAQAEGRDVDGLADSVVAPGIGDYVLAAPLVLLGLCFVSGLAQVGGVVHQQGSIWLV